MDIRQPSLKEPSRYSQVLTDLQRRLSSYSQDALLKLFAPSASDVIKEIYARAGYNNTVEDFARVFVETEELVRNRVEELQKEVRDCEAGLHDTQRKLQIAQQTEVINQHSVMEGSVLAVEVHSINLDTEHRSSMHVELTCEGKVIRTKSTLVSKTGSWEEPFTFPILHGTGDLVVAAIESVPAGKRTIGQVAIPVKLLNDQLKHTTEFTLVGGEPSELKLSLQWVWSKVQYLKSVADQWNENLASSREELMHLQQQDAVLSAFGGDVQQFPLETIDMLVTEQVDKVLEVTIGANANTALAVQLCTLCLIICSSLAMMSRPDFPNVRAI